MSNDGSIFVLVSSWRSFASCCSQGLCCQWDGIRALFLLRLGGDKARVDKNKIKWSYMICCEH